MEVVLHRVGFLEYFCPKQGQDFKPSAAPLYPNMGQVPPPPGGGQTPSFLFDVILQTFDEEKEKTFNNFAIRALVL